MRASSEGWADDSSYSPPRCRGWASDGTAPRADHTIRIAPISLEIGPNKVIQTTGYNGTVPGPPLRLKEGAPAAINVINDSGYPNQSLVLLF